jgi:hypothetical protein
LLWRLLLLLLPLRAYGYAPRTAPKLNTRVSQPLHFTVSPLLPQAERNYAAMAEAVGGSVSSSVLERRVYVGNLAAAVTEGACRRHTGG